MNKVDWLGIILLAVGIGSLQTVLERGQTEDWFATGYIIVLTVTAIVALTAFILWELHVPHPVVNLRVFKSRSLSIAAILTFITGIGMFTSVFITPVLAQRLLGFTPTETGFMLLPSAVIAIFALIVSGRLMAKGVSPILIVVLGFVCFIYFNWSMSGVNFNISAQQISINLIFRATAMAFLTVPLTMLAVSSLQPADIPQGAALNNMMRQLGGAFGISAVNTYYAQRIAVHRTDLLSHLNPYNPQAVERLKSLTSYFQGKGFGAMDAHMKGIGVLEHTISTQSSMLSYIDCYYFVGMLFVLALPLLLLVGRTQKNPAAAKMVISDH